MATHAPSMGARTRAPSVNTPSLSRFDSKAAMMRAIERACLEYKLTESRFGRMAMGDPGLIQNLRAGRTLRPVGQGKVAALIASLAGDGAYQHERREPSPSPRRQQIHDLTGQEVIHRLRMRAGSAALLAAILAAREA